MDNPWDLMRAAIEQARRVNSAADEMVQQLASIMRGRLRQAPKHILVDLKRELRDFDAHTKRWK